MYVQPNRAEPDQLIHCFNFNTVGMLNDAKTYSCEYDGRMDTIKGARLRHPSKACQMTITDNQLKSFEEQNKYDELVAAVKRENFKTVHSHKNPNSGATVHTLMSPPVQAKVPVSEKSHKAARTPDFYKAEESRLKSFWGRGFSPMSSGHEGSCCGVSTIIGFNPLLERTVGRDHWNIILGSMLNGRRLGLMHQLFVPTSILSLGHGTHQYKLRASGFQSVYQWANPLTHEKFDMFVFSPAKVETSDWLN